MSEPAWHPHQTIDAARFREARLQAHHAVQWLARAARAFIPPLPDDAHTSLIWDRPLQGFMTHPLADGPRLSLQVTSLTLAVHEREGGRIIGSLALTGCSEVAIREWLGQTLAVRGFAAQALDAPSPYEMPAHAVATGATYDAAGAADALGELAAWFATADGVIGRIRRDLLGRGLSASPVCCWPHHFDLASLTTLPTPTPGTPGYVGVGLSPGDHYYDEPYFYVSVYPRPDSAELPALPEPGHWHIHDFTAGVLPAHRIIAAAGQGSATNVFLDAAVGAALTMLGR